MNTSTRPSSGAWTYYDLATGRILGHYRGPAQWVALNQPFGAGHVPGCHHPDDAMIDVATHGVLPRDHAPSAHDQARQAKAARDAQLAACDWVALRAVETGGAVPAEWLVYRQALRDITRQPGWPDAVIWPARPQE